MRDPVVTVTYREQGHGGAVPPASGRIVSITLGRSPCGDSASDTPSPRRVTAPGCHGLAGRADREYARLATALPTGAAACRSAVSELPPRGRARTPGENGEHGLECW